MSKVRAAGRRNAFVFGAGGHVTIGLKRMASLALASEHQLLREYATTHDPQRQEELVRRFMPLARALAFRYRRACEQTDDLVQVASLGLVKALNGFDPDRGSSFTAYAAPTILGELRRHFRDRVWMLRLPRGLGEHTMAISEASQRLSEELGRTPTVGEIAKRVELSEEEVSDALQADGARKVHSLDAPASREGVSSVPIVETVGASEPGYERVDVQLAAEGAMLSDVERTVLKLRFENDLTQYEIARRLGISQMQISRLMRRALRKLLDEVVSEEERGGETLQSSSR